MSVLRLEAESPDPAVIAHAAALLRAGELVAFPTETVYGLGANAQDVAAVARIYAVKGRPASNPLIVHVPNARSARRLVTRWSDEAELLARRFWPGPLTLVLPRAPGTVDAVSAGLGSIALRVPDHPVALALLHQADIPLAAPSANRSGEVSPTRAEHVVASLGDLVPLILDGGPTRVGIESTVVDLTGAVARILRPGMITSDTLRGVLGKIEVATERLPSEIPRPSPGMLERHYAPKATLMLVDSAVDPRGVALARELHGQGRRVAALMLVGRPDGSDEVTILPRNPEEYARELYGALHRIDATAPALILVERPPAGVEWDAIRDRLERAAYPHPFRS